MEQSTVELSEADKPILTTGGFNTPFSVIRGHVDSQGAGDSTASAPSLTWAQPRSIPSHRGSTHIPLKSVFTKIGSAVATKPVSMS